MGFIISKIVVANNGIKSKITENVLTVLLYIPYNIILLLYSIWYNYRYNFWLNRLQYKIEKKKA